MKQIIRDILDDVAKTQVNLKSEATKEMIVNLIVDSIKSKGGRIFYGKPTTANYPVKKIDKWLTRDIDEIQMIDQCSHGNDINSTCMECDELQARDTWICRICGKSTYAVEYDYVGSGTNHLGCELEIEMKNKDNDENI